MTDIIVDFFGSSFAESLGPTVVIIIFTAILASFFTWWYLSKIHYKIKLNKCVENEKKLEQVENEKNRVLVLNQELNINIETLRSDNEHLEKEIDKLKFDIATSKGVEIFDDPGLERFTSKDKKQ